MAYNFKHLADVELLSAMPKDAKVLVEVNGTTKRAPQVDEIAKIIGSKFLDKVPAGATMLAEVNGEIKRVPSEELGEKGMVVNFTMVNPENETIAADKTYEEIRLALREGRHVVGILNIGASEYILNVCSQYEDFMTEVAAPAPAPKGYIVFYSLVVPRGNTILGIVVSSDNTISSRELLQIPSITDLISDGSSDAITSGAVYTALQAKQNIITDHIILSSSTTDSTKKFKITVDDSGALTATEVTA